MTFTFNPASGNISVVARVLGPLGTSRIVLCLDTGATSTTIHMNFLLAAGYSPTQFSAPLQLATASGIVYAPRLSVTAFEALGVIRMNYPVFAHTLPIPSGADGLLGLDFFDGRVLTLDFPKGEITLAPGSPTGPTP